MIPLLPPITIGISFFNAETTILDAIRSVYAQTHKDWELILVDDGSTDKSLELVKSIKDPRIRVLSDGKNKRLAARLNQISEMASYEYIARMDADDLIASNRIERQLLKLVSNPDLDLVSTGVCSLTDSNVPVGIRRAPKFESLNGRNLLLGRSGIVHASVVGRTNWFLRNKYRENIKIGQDANLWVRAFANRDLKIDFIDEPLYYYREDGNVTAKKLKGAYTQMLGTIWNDSGSVFSLGDRIQAYLVTLSKLGVANILHANNSLNILRERRNGDILSKEERERLLGEISFIQAVKLPR